MAVLPILKYPDPVLKKKSKPVVDIDKKIKRLAADMLETMYNAHGLGLAAIQVGVPVRMLVLDAAQVEGPPEPIVCINPELVSSEGKLKVEEGCLSVPGYNAPVERYRKVVIKFTTLEGDCREIEAEELVARILQHELDHLDGILFVDKLGRIRKELFLRRMKKQSEEEWD